MTVRFLTDHKDAKGRVLAKAGELGQTERDDMTKVLLRRNGRWVKNVWPPNLEGLPVFSAEDILKAFENLTCQNLQGWKLWHDGESRDSEVYSMEIDVVNHTITFQ